MTPGETTSASLKVAPARLEDLEAFAEHLLRLERETIFDGIPTMPRAPQEAPTREEVVLRFREPWSRTLEETSWTRTWVLWDGATVVGHVNLHGGRFRSELHRALLGTGLESAYRGRALGKRLLQAALAWAREMPLSWLELLVFAHNTPAVRLYEHFGFDRVAHIRDRCRFGDRSVDELHMVLCLTALKVGNQAT